MADNKITGGPKFTTPITTGDAGAVQQTQRTEQSGAPQRIDISQIPERSEINTKSSPLEGLLAQGLARLAESKGWEATQSSLDVLMGAMTAAKPRSASAANSVTDAVGQVRTQFASLLRGAVDVTPETIRAIKDDAPKLVSLAVVALGGAEATGRAAGQQLVTDLGEVRKALADVMAKPAPERNALIQSRLSELGTMATVLDRGRSALDAAKAKPIARLDALRGVFEILAKYANPFPQIPS